MSPLFRSHIHATAQIAPPDNCSFEPPSLVRTRATVGFCGACPTRSLHPECKSLLELAEALRLLSNHWPGEHAPAYRISAFIRSSGSPSLLLFFLL